MLLFPLGSIAQNNDSIQAQKYFRLFSINEYTNVKKARAYADSGLFFAKQTNNPIIIATGYQYLGWYYQDRSKYKLANEQFYKSLSYFRKADYKQGIANAYGNLGNSYLDMEDFQKSLKNQLRSLQVNEEILAGKLVKDELENALEGRAYAWSNIAAIYSEIEMYEKALEYEFKGVAYEVESGSKIGEGISYNTIATIYKNTGKLDSAEIYFKKSLKIFEKNNHPFNYSTTLLEYSTLKESELSASEKVQMIKKALKIRKELGDAEGEARTLIEICDNYFKSLSTDSLSRMLKRSYQLIEQEDLEGLKQEYFRIYSKYNSRLGAYKNAYFALENYLELKAISDEKSRTHDLIVDDVKYQLRVQHESEQLKLKNRHEKERLGDQKDFALKKAEHNAEIAEIQNFVYLGIIGFIILIAILFVFISSSRRRKRINDLLSEKNSLIEDQKNIVEEKNQSISDSINYARRLQTAILPTAKQINEFLPNSFLFFRPKDVVSGDFHWFEKKGDLLFIAVADCTGHGVPGAMVSVVCSNALNRTVNEFGLTEPKNILDKTREIVIDTFAKSGENVTDGMDISLVSVDKMTKIVRFAGAHNSLWIVRDTDQVEVEKFDAKRLMQGENRSLMEFKGDKQPIGLYEDIKKFNQIDIPLCDNDILYLFSDGFADQFGGEFGKKFKYGPFKKLLLKNCDLPLDSQKKELVATFEDWQGDQDQIDDICVMGIKVLD